MLSRDQMEQRFACEYEPQADEFTLSIDFETYCDIDLKEFGLDLYSIHPSCEVLMCAYKIGSSRVRIWDAASGARMPARLRDAIEDERYKIHAFNAQFERTIMNRVLGIWPDMERWRCTMVLAYFHSFTGNLAMISRQMDLDEDKQKSATGTKLMKMFSMPQKITKANSLTRFTAETHPIEWAMFLEYCIQDVVAETAIWDRLDKPKYPIPEREWEFYALDQIINDRGLPMDTLFARNALEMANERKAVLLARMNRLTGLMNAGSPAQLLPWLKERGYPFDDLKKDSVIKTLTAYDGIQKGELEPGPDVLYPDELTKRAVTILKLRRQQARTTTTKYAALLKAVGEDGRLRFVFQFCGASRTGRFAGRRFQPQNLTTMRLGGEDSTHLSVITMITDAIRENDYEAVRLFRAEPLDALAGLVRSSVRAPRGKKLVVCDLSSIESVVIGWVSDCERLLNVFREGRDAYKDFATELFKVPYAEVTSKQRKMSKPATLGAGYRLGGGEIKDGKRTGLWGYSENMGIDMTKAEAKKSVDTFRRVYSEIVECWYELENAIKRTIKRGHATKVGEVKFRLVKPYLIAELPSGRCIYYKAPRISRKRFTGTDAKTGEPYEYFKDSISYMGKTQNGNTWTRIFSHGGKFIENLVQAIARDILREGLLRLHKVGFWLVGHVHDEAISEEKVGDETHNVAMMRECMIRKIRWAKGLPLNAAGHEGKIYRKD